MTYSLDIRPDALVDIEKAAQWYEDQAGLGSDFTGAILQAIDTVQAHPLICRLRDRRRNVRWLLATRFPYRIAYRLQGERITIYAVIHSARHDRQWQGRV